ncbi:VRR-NUC domain-containing protein [Pilobolus umbonatus]|nr:VRR-NUC domain-containing protein [Pilobolus umbonatus]
MQFLMTVLTPPRLHQLRQLIGECVQLNMHIYLLYQRLQIIYYRVHHLNSFNPSTAILSRLSKNNYPIYSYNRSSDIWLTRDEVVAYEQALRTEKEFEDTDDWSLCENIIEEWERSLQNEIEKPYFMRRFEAGAIYTRLLDHGRHILAKSHEFLLEATILTKLLDQTRYRRGTRGKWYERLALIQMTHLVKNQKNKRDVRIMKKKALETCLRAIRDQHVHQTYLHSIYKRINRLERDLCIPIREQHDFSYSKLKEPVTRTIYGERVSEDRIGMKSVWRSDNGAECSVEEVAIEYYNKQGYKGLHAENGVIKMMTVLLFWDVIFAPVHGVFETPYQIAPMDLYTDAFYEGRISLIQERLNEIEKGKYLQLIQSVYEREYERRTMAAGINWDYDLQDIMEIAECLGPLRLSSLCNLLLQEYRHRQSGMPDLCCWNFREKKCLFSEVKGPGDILSPTQKLWIETLSGLGIPVEVCHVKVWKGDDILLNE